MWSTHEKIFVSISFIDNSTTNERSYSNCWNIAIITLHRHHCEGKSLVIYFDLSKLHNNLKLATLSISSELGATSKFCSCLKLITMSDTSKLLWAIELQTVWISPVTYNEDNFCHIKSLHFSRLKLCFFSSDLGNGWFQTWHVFFCKPSNLLVTVPKHFSLQ